MIADLFVGSAFALFLTVMCILIAEILLLSSIAAGMISLVFRALGKKEDR